MSQCNHQPASTGAHPHYADVRVNDALINANEIAREAQYHPAETAQQALESAAQALVVRQLLREQAIAKGFLEAQAVIGAEQEEQAFQALLEHEVQIPPHDEQAVERYYRANLTRFTTPPLLEVSHILVAADPEDFSARQAARERAEVLIELCNGDADGFMQLAASESDCPSRVDRGSLGQIGKGQTTPEFERQLFLLPVGLSPTPLESRYGYHVVWVWQREDGQQRSLADCHQQIQDYLQDHAWLKGVNQYLNMLVGEADIQGFDIQGATSPLMN